MQRVTRSTAAAVLPAAPANPGTPGYFTGGDPVSNVPATVPGYEWFNGVQEELIAALVDGGLTPDPAVLTQVRQAIRRLAGANVSTLSANTTLTADHAGFVLASAAAGNVTLTLPAANAAGGRPVRIAISRTDASANTLTIQRAGTDTVNGVTGGPLPVGATVVLMSDGASAWTVVGGAGLREVKTFLASGSSTVPWWARMAYAQVWGGGGGGGGAYAGAAGSGGGGGGYCAGLFSVTPGQSYPVTVGGGGSAGVANVSNGGSGGTSSFGSLLSATGGEGGLSTTAGPTAGVGGGSASGGAVAMAGQPTAWSYVIGSKYLGSGGGGSAAGGPPTAMTVDLPFSGVFPGGGASGAVNAYGGVGAAGLVIVEYLP